MRPQGFGKTLFLEMLAAYFKGQRHLFEGLEIAYLEDPQHHEHFNHPFNWEPAPVLDLNFTGILGADVE